MKRCKHKNREWKLTVRLSDGEPYRFWTWDCAKCGMGYGTNTWAHARDAGCPKTLLDYGYFGSWQVPDDMTLTLGQQQ